MEGGIGSEKAFGVDWKKTETPSPKLAIVMGDADWYNSDATLRVQ
jgi:hypothetical protein